MSPAFKDPRIRWIAGVLALVKLWFVSAQPVAAVAHANHDDRLFLLLAEQIAGGHWLGPYSQMTLAKGSGYPLFIAGSFLAGIPLPLAEHGLYLLATWLLVRALRPALPNDLWALAAFGAIAWQPMSYGMPAPHDGSILRQNLYTPLTLLIFAGLIALWARRHSTRLALSGWAALLGLSFGWFYLTREESVWIVPSAGLLVGGAALAAWRERRVRPFIGTIAIAASTAAAPILAVCALNLSHYGWFGTVEFRAPAFVEAYGALTRVQVGPPLPEVPVTDAARRAIYPVSPAFAELRPLLEGRLGRNWGGGQLEIGAGMWMWALRDAVALAGHTSNAASALAFYRRVADEVNAACDAGRIPAGPPRATLLPPWRKDYTAAVLPTAFRFIGIFARFENFTARPPHSAGDGPSLQLFRDLTEWPLAFSAEAPELDTPRARAQRAWRIGALQDIGTLLAWLDFFILLAALAAWCWTPARCLWRRRPPPYLWWLATAALGGVLAVIAIVVLLNVTSWPDWRPIRFAEAYPLALLFAFAAAAAAVPSSGDGAHQHPATA